MKTQVTMQGPDAGSGAADGDTEVVKRKIADHALVDASGTEVDTEELATGISYKIVRDKETGEAVDLPAFIFQVPNAQPGSAATMLAIFGAKTLATNESSQARNAKGDNSPAAQLEAVKERFALLTSGTWVDRTREGGFQKTDKDALAGAVIDAAKAAGKPEPDYAAVRQKLEEDEKFVRAVKSVPAIAQAYAVRVGRQGKSLDDVLAGIA